MCEKNIAFYFAILLFLQNAEIWWVSLYFRYSRNNVHIDISVLSLNVLELHFQVYKKPVFKEDSYLELYRKSKKVFNSRQLQALQRLYQWRDKLGRMEDESTG